MLKHDVLFFGQHYCTISNPSQSQNLNTIRYHIYSYDILTETDNISQYGPPDWI